MAAKRTVTANDLYNIHSVTDPQWSPNGAEAVFVKTHIDADKHEYVSNLYHLETESKRVTQWTYGKGATHSPVWSPDGSRVAFISDRSGKNQLYVMPAAGGEAEQVTDIVYGVSSPQWTPCGKKIAFSVSLKEDESVKDEKKEEKKELTAFVTSKMKYKADGVGLLQGKASHIVVLTLESGDLKQLTSGEHGYTLQGFSPDGKWLTYVTNDEAEDQDHSFNNELYIVNLETNEREKIATKEGYTGGAEWSPDQRYIGYLASDREHENASHTKLWVYDVEQKTSQCLTEGIDAPVGDYVVADIQQRPKGASLIWTGNEAFYFVLSDHGNASLYYGSVHGEVYPALDGNHHVYDYSIHAESQQAIVAISTPVEAGELYLLHVPTGKLTKLTQFNEQWESEVELVAPEAVSYESTGGLTVHGWLMKPAGYTEGTRYPLVVEIHGGPHAMYANSFFHEMQLLAAQGYGVLYVNPRGSHGYGQSFVDAVRGDYGGGDYEDIMAGVDAVLADNDWIDRDRLGVTGGSYGGFMTNWIVSHTDRFKAAVTQRSISNWISFYGVSDIGYYFSEWQIQADLNDFDTLWKHSPLAYVDAVQTPLLILHSEKDYRCPIEQAEQLYIALKRKGKETTLVRFPEADHNLSRTGKPNLRIERLEQITGWFKRYL